MSVFSYIYSVWRMNKLWDVQHESGRIFSKREKKKPAQLLPLCIRDIPQLYALTPHGV